MDSLKAQKYDFQKCIKPIPSVLYMMANTKKKTTTTCGDWIAQMDPKKETECVIQSTSPNHTGEVKIWFEKSLGPLHDGKHKKYHDISEILLLIIYDYTIRHLNNK